MKECLLYDKIDTETVGCRACHHFCRIKDGQVGVCGVRQNVGGKLYSLVYGQAAAVNVDPIEKKPLFHFLPGSLAFSFGTMGCNFRCANCHNFEISQVLGKKGKVTEYGELNFGDHFSPEKIVAEALANNCQSIAYTYTEPTIFLEYALETMKLARKRGLKNVWVSNGFMSEETLDLIIPYLDAINVDIKSFAEQFYASNCGGKLSPVLENCRRMVREKVWLEVTTLIIPTLSDNTQLLEDLAAFIKKDLGEFVPWHVSAFSGSLSWKLQDLPDTSERTIEKICALGKEAGLHYVYGGNVRRAGLEDTFCPQCKTKVIERAGYQVVNRLNNNQCPSCKNQLAGIF